LRFSNDIDEELNGIRGRSDRSARTAAHIPPGPTRRAPFAVVAAAVVASGCGIAHAPAGGAPPGRSEATTYQLIQEPDAGYSPVIGVISHARRSIRMTMYEELTDPQATAALFAAHARGVNTKVLLDAAFHGRYTNTAAFEQLNSAASTCDGGWRRSSSTK
jgi:cardiolipin synthase